MGGCAQPWKSKPADARQQPAATERSPLRMGVTGRVADRARLSALSTVECVQITRLYSENASMAQGHSTPIASIIGRISGSMM